MIVVAGDALVDLLVGADGTIVPVAGGSTFNTVRAIARLGVPCAWLGSLSDDRFGRQLDAALGEDGVDRSLIRRSHLPTTLALAELGPDGAATYRFYADGTSMPDLPPTAIPTLPAGTAAVALGSLGLVLEPAATALEQLTAGLPGDVLLAVDPNCRPSITPDPDAYRARLGRVLARADVVKASVEDLEYLRPGETVDAAIAWVVGHGPRVVLVTDGARPLTVVAGGERLMVEAPAVRVVDTVGAGDTFGGAFLACLLAGGTRRATLDDVEAIARAARFAVRASAAVCGRAGANPPTLAELGGWPPMPAATA